MAEDPKEPGLLSAGGMTVLLLGILTVLTIAGLIVWMLTVL